MESTIAKLTKAVAKQVGGKDTLKEIAQDVCSHGAQSGFPGFIYTGDTEAFYLKNKALIIEMAQEMADSLGETLVGMIKNYLDATEKEIGETLYGNKRKCDRMVANSLAWFALEQVAQHLIDN